MRTFGKLALSLAFCCLPSLVASEKVEFFESRIRPILTQECYECHSERHKAKGGLLLDSRPGLEAGGDTGPSIVPGNAEESFLYQTIMHHVEDEDMRMPKQGAKLEDSVLADFKKWIDDGAVDPRNTAPSDEQLAADTDWGAIAARRAQHWSFLPVPSRAVAEDEIALTRQIDQLIEKQWDENAVSPSALADRWTVLRRLNFILTGLPASLVEQQQFSDLWDKEGREAAVASKVDELLASPHFGEKWAQHWLDWYRYTEGHGGQGDPKNERAHEYRDYVIRALNDNVPYDQLVKEQIAGDLLSTPRLNEDGLINESRIGVAQLRFVEHGFLPVDALDEKVKFTDNQVDVITKATMGLTVSCARCHDHKFDAVSHADYHAIFGVLASSNPSHRPLLESSQIDSQREALEAARKQLESELKSSWLNEVKAPEFRDKLQSFVDSYAPTWETLPPANDYQDHLTLGDYDALRFLRNQRESTDLPKSWAHFKKKVLSAKADNVKANEAMTKELIDFRNGLPAGWYQRDGSSRAVPAGELGMGVDDEMVAMSVLPAGLISHASTTQEDAAIFSPKFEYYDGAIGANWSGGGFSQFRYVVQNYPMVGSIYRYFPATDSGELLTSSDKFEFWKGEKGHLQFNTRRLAPAPPRGPNRPGAKPPRFHPTPRENGSWFHVSEVRLLKEEDDRLKPALFSSEILFHAEPDFTTFPEALVFYQQQLLRVLERWQTDAFSDADALFVTEFLRANILSRRIGEVSPGVEGALTKLRSVEASFADIARRTAPGVVDSEGFDQALYLRGNHKTPAEIIPRGFIDVIDDEDFQLGEESGRLQLAEKIVSAGNPLFDRVAVNRFWSHVFGEGIVSSVDNFGRTGKQPTHPELLDVLAFQFRDDGFDIKELLRSLLNTTTFQRQSTPTATAAELDPTNRLLSHARIRRLDAEGVRDHLLALGGALDLRMFGGQTPPPLAETSDKRRSLYITRMRRGRIGLMDVFDMPVPSSTRGMRDASTTPAQSISMMNSPFVKLQSERWAESHSDKAAKEAFGLLLTKAFSRPPSSSQVGRLMEFYELQGADAEALAHTAHLVTTMKEFIYLR